MTTHATKSIAIVLFCLGLSLCLRLNAQENKEPQKPPFKLEVNVNTSNDLQGGFKTLTAGPEYVYLLAFSPQDVKPDGAYHSLKVKVDRDGLHLRARRGYFALKPPKHKAS